MAKVRTFRINPAFGVPDQDIKAWLDMCEAELGIISVNTTYIPALGKADPRFTVVVTKLDDHES